MKRTRRMKTLSASLVVCVAVSILPACGVYQARTIGKEEAKRFHEQFNLSRYADIYRASSPEFRKSVTEEEWIAVCTEIRKRFGQWKTWEPKDKDSEVLLVDSGGYIVTLNYMSQFELGQANEALRFAVKDDKASLLSYNVVSPLLER